MTVYVVVLNWNGWKDTIQCLDSLYKSKNVNFCVVVCDNGSSDNSIFHIEEWAQINLGSANYQFFTKSQLQSSSRETITSLTIIDNQGNWGFAGGNNIGIKFALKQDNCEYIWLLNNDTIIEPDALYHAVERMKANQAIGLCGSTLVYYHERNKLQAMGGAVYSKYTGRSAHIGAFSSPQLLPTDYETIERQMSYVVGAAMLVRRSFVETVGLMQEDYFLYSEEIDWATRGKSKFKLGYAPKSVVYHKEGASIGTSASGGSPLSIYYLYRNRLKFTWRFYPIFFPTVLLYASIDVLKFTVKGKWKQAIAAVKGILFLKR
ncbi:glycosyltransferase family 2 protein [Methylophilus sp. TWE2]|uniref:glycosyltransferase family 2 protein n=1 Tax=Methylophilus sp. TWE2 TaxID=1662285 RepID=UPI000671799A|nr:glycosyltransferase family 2 protein [Methylophilus sp. TWE2]AKR43389.1 hypothetical protein ACJ67_08085 [Methylophilus sp. TWE2]